MGMLISPSRFSSGLRPLRTNLVGWWDMEESGTTNRADAVGVNALTPNVTIAAVAGRVGNCASLVASNYMNTGTSPAGLLLTSGAFTVAGWINTSAASTGLLSRWEQGTNNRVYCLIVEAGVATFAVSSDGINPVSVTVGSGVNNSAWRFLMGYRSTTDGKIYVSLDNGTPVGTAFSAANSLFSTSTGLYGGALNSTTYAGDCKVDSCGIWSRELSAAERTTLYNAGAGLNYAAL